MSRVSRKNSGFGNPKSYSFRGIKGVNKSTNKPDRPKAAGDYPSNRQYGSMVQSTVIERYDRESDWTRWRRGYEYYSQGKFGDLKQYNPVTQQYQESILETVLYEGTTYQLDLRFTGRRFATQNSDVRNHYVTKREVTNDVAVLSVTNVIKDDDTAKENGAILVQGNNDAQYGLLYEGIGERFTDGQTEATMMTPLNADKHPGIYTGKSVNISDPLYSDVYDVVRAQFPYEDPNDGFGLTTVVSSILAQDLDGNPFFEEFGLDGFIGKIVYIPEFYNIEWLTDPGGGANFIDTVLYTDFKDYFYTLVYDRNSSSLTVANNDTNLPPSLYDINELEPIFKTDNSIYELLSGYLFNKADYQQWWGDEEVTAEGVLSECQVASYGVLPYVIRAVDKGIQLVNINNTIYFVPTVHFISEPFQSTFKTWSISTPLSDNYYAFTDYSFTETTLDTDGRGEYKHPVEGPYNTVAEQIAGGLPWSSEVWYKKQNDIDPYTTDVFLNPQYSLKPATLYTCSCPNFSKSQLRMPESTQDEGSRKTNRQKRYPLPTVQGRSDYQSIGLDSAAGVIATWGNELERMKFRLCKHSIAAMFGDHLKLQEPNTYQTVAAREEFAKKLAVDIASLRPEGREAYERGGISTLEIVFALAQAFNYDEVAIAELVLNAKF